MSEAILLDYFCLNCGIKKTNQEMDSMMCQCGGDFKPDGSLFGEQPLFEPYYDRVLRCRVSSYSEQERLAVAHRSRSHPDGLRLVQWDRNWCKELKNMHNNREDVRQQEAKEAGHTYKPGSKARWSDKHNGFVGEGRGKVVFQVKK